MRLRSPALATLLCSMAPVGARGEVTAATMADVTPAGFAVVWVSDEPVTAASVRVFSDSEGAIEITNTLTQSLSSAAAPPALDLGVVKVDVRGVAPSTCLYVQTLTTGQGGVVAQPATSPFPEVCTQAAVRKENALGGPIANDLVRHEVLVPDASVPAAGALVLLEVPGVSAAPVSAFVGVGFGASAAVTNLQNLFAEATGRNLEVADGAVLRLLELRGGTCPFPDQSRERYRRAPGHEEVVTVGARISQVEEAAGCFFADTDCSGLVTDADAERVLAALPASQGDCRFDVDLDALGDDRIDILDVQRVLNRVGDAAP